MTLVARKIRGPVVAAAVVGVSTGVAVDPLWDPATGQAVGFAELSFPLAYRIGAPLFGVWDALSLLTASQHNAVLATLAVLYVAHRLRARGPARGVLVRGGVEVARALGAFVLLLAFYLAGLLIPRPMVGLTLREPDLLAVDFHSHTDRSHDGWSLFTASRNRAWHEAGGFDVAYVTDHYTWAGFDDGRADNPERAGERTALLVGAEVRIHGRPTNILGARDRYLSALDADSIQLSADSLAASSGRGGPPATLLFTMPGPLDAVVPFAGGTPAGVIGIELNDGSPRGLEQVKRERTEILALAESYDLAVVGASNLHGWGRTAASWSVMSLPGWQDRSPEEVGAAIEAKLHADRRAAVTVVERRMPYHGESAALLALTLPWLAWEHVRMLGAAERVSWLFWLAALAMLHARRAVAPGEGAPAASPPDGDHP